jgi:hypothetical protein
MRNPAAAKQAHAVINASEARFPRMYIRRTKKELVQIIIVINHD